MAPGRRPRDSCYDSTQNESHPDDALDIAHLVVSNGRIHREAMDCRPTKIRVLPETLDDEFAGWVPVGGSFNTGLHDEDGGPIDGESERAPDNDNEDELEGSAKRKRFASDDPMNAWKPLIPLFLREMYLHDGVGVTGDLECLTCHAKFSPTCRLFKCEACCVTLECTSCTIVRHQCHPLHVIKEWTGKYWNAASLSDIGLVYQLGHHGLSCRLPYPLIRNMTIISTNGIHEVRLCYCNCQAFNPSSNIEQLLRHKFFPATVTDPATCATFEVLDLFRLLSVVGNVTAYDFVTTLERLTSGAGTEDVSDRYKAFGRMAREYPFLLRIRRCGALEMGLSTDFVFSKGQLALLCWACPNEGKNLPPKWQHVDPKYMYLYTLILAIDANFRLKNVSRPNERDDPPLASGGGYFVELAQYKEYLLNYIPEKDVSSCMAFAALAQKDTKTTKGLRTSGVVACACARHELIRPNGIGDLQKGERYANVDFIFFSVIQGLRLRRYVLSYDVVCQWKKLVWDRLFRLPPQLRFKGEAAQFIFGLPTWHAMVHERTCRAENSLVYQLGVGRTDGEGIERVWSSLNPAAYSTKEMTEGGRIDTLEDRIDYHNFSKNKGLGIILLKRLIFAEEQYEIQKANFEDIDGPLNEETSLAWGNLIDQWNANRNDNPNPYVVEQQQSITSREAEIRLDLAAEEAKLVLSATAPIRETSPTTFVTVALQLEEAQRKLCFDIKNSTGASLVAEGKIQQRRTAILQKVKKLREMQHVYVPGAARAEEGSSSSANVLPENIALYLPSDFCAFDRVTACEEGLGDIEKRLREGQCLDAISELRRHLRSKHHLILFRNANVVGQVQATRSRTLIDNVSRQVDFSAEKYRRARVSLESLGGDLTAFPPLLNEDLTLDSWFDEDYIAVHKLASIAQRRVKKAVPSGERTLSWIWTAGGGPDISEEGLLESVRIEWSKAKARRDRWYEEVTLLREEMRRVLRYLRTVSGQWDDLYKSSLALGDPVAIGRAAYAARQAFVHATLAARFKDLWSSAFNFQSALIDALPHNDPTFVKLL